MRLHEKSLELNITRELLNLADCWYWFLIDIPLFRYWRPRYRLPFIPAPSFAAAFHTVVEGKNDPTGKTGGGFDVRISSGGHLLFIQYKKGSLKAKSPAAKSIFHTPPSEHYMFEINSTKTDQHLTLRNLSKGRGGKPGNAVVYAFPLIADMEELSRHAGKLLRRTRFVPIKEIDILAASNGTPIEKGQKHKFRISATDMNRCEMNLLLLLFIEPDVTGSVIADAMVLGFQKILNYCLPQIVQAFRESNLYYDYLNEGMRRAFTEYLRYIIVYFEVSPSRLDKDAQDLLLRFFEPSWLSDNYFNFNNDKRDIAIVSTIFNALSVFSDFMYNVSDGKAEDQFTIKDIPYYESTIFINNSNGFRNVFPVETNFREIEGISYLVI